MTEVEVDPNMANKCWLEIYDYPGLTHAEQAHLVEAQKVAEEESNRAIKKKRFHPSVAYLSQYALALTRLTNHSEDPEHPTNEDGTLVYCPDCVGLRKRITDHDKPEDKVKRQPKAWATTKCSSNYSHTNSLEEMSDHEMSDAEDERELDRLETERSTGSIVRSNASSICFPMSCSTR